MITIDLDFKIKIQKKKLILLSINKYSSLVILGGGCGIYLQNFGLYSTIQNALI